MQYRHPATIHRRLKELRIPVHFLSYYPISLANVESAFVSPLFSARALRLFPFWIIFISGLREVGTCVSPILPSHVIDSLKVLHTLSSDSVPVIIASSPPLALQLGVRCGVRCGVLVLADAEASSAFTPEYRICETWLLFLSSRRGLYVLKKRITFMLV